LFLIGKGIRLMTNKEMIATEVRAYWEKLKRPTTPAIPTTAAEGVIIILHNSASGAEAVVAEFTDKKLRVLALKDGEAKILKQFDTPFDLEEIFDLKVMIWMPTEWTLCAAITHPDHPPMILHWRAIIGWSFTSFAKFGIC